MVNKLLLALKTLCSLCLDLISENFGWNGISGVEDQEDEYRLPYSFAADLHPSKTYKIDEVRTFLDLKYVCMCDSD